MNAPSYKRAFVLLGLLAALLSSGVLLWSATKEPAEPSLTQPLRELLPTGEEFGWQHEDLPLGPTEALAEASQEMLNMTDWVYRRYTKGPDSFEVYIAYWEPGRMPARKMNEHTPDTCWVGGGWKIIEKKDDFYLPTEIHSPNPDANPTAHRPPPTANAEASGPATLPGRWRWFEKRGQRINVVFWHILDGNTYQYGHQSLEKRFWKLLSDPFVYRFNIRREQFLIRFSSNSEIEPLMKRSLFSKITQDLGQVIP